MSPHPAHQIIDEFLQAEDSSAQARRNAAVALATIADDTALQKLLQLAISDGDAGVRSTAEAELATLCRQSPANLGPAMAATLGSPEQAPPAYALIGRLQAQGAILPPLPATLPWLHLALSLYRSVGVPARYVSGYFYAVDVAGGSAPDTEEIAVQTHAWLEVAVPGWGWWALDPTNLLPAGERHVKIGHGRMYADVPPVVGTFSGEAESTVEAHVSMRRVPETL